VGTLLCRLLQLVKPFLDHSFQNVRSRLGAVLCNIFAIDVDFEGNNSVPSTYPKEQSFVEEIFPLLASLSGDKVLESSDSSLRLLQTLSNWLRSSCVTSIGPLRSHLFKFLPLLLQYEWFDNDPHISKDCQATLSCLSRINLSTDVIPVVLDIITNAGKSDYWKTRLACLDFLQAFIFNNFVTLCSPNLHENSIWREAIVGLLMTTLDDKQIEVRVKSSQVFGGMIHCQFIPPSQCPEIIVKFQTRALDLGLPSTLRHGAVLGLCSFVSAFPHAVPSLLPPLVCMLGRLLHCPAPIPQTVKKCLQNFKRTHQDNWVQHKQAFTEDQLSELTNLLVSPSYYA